MESQSQNPEFRNNPENFHPCVGYMVGDLVLWRCASVAVKHDFRMYIRRCTSPNENYEYGYPHSNALLQFPLKVKHCKLHKAACHPTKCDVIDVKLFLLSHFFDIIQSNVALKKQVH